MARIRKALPETKRTPIVVHTNIAGVDGQFALDLFDFITSVLNMRHNIFDFGGLVTIRTSETRWINGAGFDNPRFNFEGPDWSCSLTAANIILGGDGCLMRWGTTAYAILKYEVHNEAGWLRDMTVAKLVGLEVPQE
jgi:hypothetical protein